MTVRLYNPLEDPRGDSAGPPDVEAAIQVECAAVAEMLITKNRAYGNSALVPLRVFSRADAGEAMRVRMDDKLSRIARGDGSGDEDAELDLIGYLVLARVQRRLASENSTVGEDA